MTKIAFIFPGQGSQSVGMGADFVTNDENSKRFYDRADAALGFSLTDIMLNGPQEKLTLTYHAQPALLTSGVMIANKLQQAGVKPHFVAGHSLGEYSALVVANVLSFDAAVQTVHKRGVFMDEAVPAGQGAMAAILALDGDKLAAICQEVSAAGEVVQVANFNCPGQIVISGTKQGVDEACSKAKEAGAKRALPLVVSGPFHSSLMQQAADQLAQIIDNLSLQTPTIPVVSNVTAELLSDVPHIKRELVAQVTSSVLWEQNVKKLIAEGVTVFIECGPGKVLSGLVKKIDRNVQTYCVYDDTSLAQVMEASKEWTQWV
ncbi:[acyl-carrier-protein] S-malonyltransferase [Lysinibacillus sp. 2017]|uniref:ACP S-malonyltransferase n=1 Tax=unclassified Lysinibacillus TaxID=2636778 RepID=UPI000D5274EC|nr:MULTISPECIES: ACP S-malonyltransferase [unclassified Lysinibacillus]AWE06642.1 [acyl-carrier-protein] S-malonyltransferase [Lysinibacillus sp. 2017]TGN37425.1 ACP S-malonyltransferase [Lysinibacillus sp. S2017]